MSKKTFTIDEQNILIETGYIKKITDKSVEFTLEFKLLFMHEYRAGIKTPRQIFIEHGIDVEIIGQKRIEQCAFRWNKHYKAGGVTELEKHGASNKGRKPVELSETDQMLAEIELLKMENSMLKKLDANERRLGKEKEITLKYHIINDIINKFNVTKFTRHLCKLAGVSLSGFYAFAKRLKTGKVTKRELDENIRKHNIQQVFNAHKEKVGAKQIRMILENEFDVIYNLKSIKRIMRKYGMICKIRRRNPYKDMIKATQEHRIFPNILKRNFKQEIPYKVLLTDITYIPFMGKHIYLSAIKDGSTNEIVAFNISDSLKMPLVLDTLSKLDSKLFAEGALIHSDQGSHYTSPKFSKQVSELGLIQSMSRRGNCWDNAPMESFFGHLKDNIDISHCRTLENAKEVIADYIYYYNNGRYQWNINKMTPIQYRCHLEVQI